MLFFILHFPPLEAAFNQSTQHTECIHRIYLWNDVHNYSHNSAFHF